MRRLALGTGWAALVAPVWANKPKNKSFELPDDDMFPEASMWAFPFNDSAWMTVEFVPLDRRSNGVRPAPV